MLPLNTKPGTKVWHLRHNYQIEEVELEFYHPHMPYWVVKSKSGKEMVSRNYLFKTKQAAVKKAKAWLKELTQDAEANLVRLQEYKANLEKSQS